MAFAAAARVAGLAVGVPLGAGITTEQQGIDAERCVRFHRAVAAWAGAFQCFRSVQGCGHGFSFPTLSESSLMPPAPTSIGFATQSGHGDAGGSHEKDRAAGQL